MGYARYYVAVTRMRVDKFFGCLIVFVVFLGGLKEIEYFELFVIGNVLVMFGVCLISSGSVFANCVVS